MVPSFMVRVNCRCDAEPRRVPCSAMPCRALDEVELVELPMRCTAGLSLAPPRLAGRRTMWDCRCNAVPSAALPRRAWPGTMGTADAMRCLASRCGAAPRDGQCQYVALPRLAPRRHTVQGHGRWLNCRCNALPRLASDA